MTSGSRVRMSTKILRNRINSLGLFFSWKLEHVRLDGVLCILFIFLRQRADSLAETGSMTYWLFVGRSCANGEKNPGYEKGPIWTSSNYFYRRCVPACYALSKSTVTAWCETECNEVSAFQLQSTSLVTSQLDAQFASDGLQTARQVRRGNAILSSNRQFVRIRVSRLIVKELKITASAGTMLAFVESQGSDRILYGWRADLVCARTLVISSRIVCWDGFGTDQNRDPDSLTLWRRSHRSNCQRTLAEFVYN